LLRYRNYLIRLAREEVSANRLLCLKLRRPLGGRIWLREIGTDHSTLEEILVSKIYGPVVDRVIGCRYIVDLGANIGLASRFLAAAYPQGTILAVEPDSANFSLLNRNLAHLVFEGRCMTERAAVWPCETLLGVTLPPEGEKFSRIRVVDDTLLASAQVVHGLTMSRLLERSGFPHVDLLKIDIEGAEAKLFRGDLSWLDRVNAIAVEFHEDSRAQSRFDTIMRQHGFEVDDSHAHTVIAIRRPGGHLWSERGSASNQEP
jgi:FkbM family methyltransferase